MHSPHQMIDAASAPLSPPRTVLYTGSGGRVGNQVISLLEGRGYEMIPADIRNTDPPTPRFREVDVRDFDQVMQACEGVDAVVHAAIASSRAFGIVDERFHPQEEKLEFDHVSFDVNVKGTYNVLEAARRHGIRRVVFLSSLTTVFGQPERPLPPHPRPAPVNVYACTKLCGEQLGEVFSRTFGMSVLSLRIGQPYPLHLAREPEWVATPRTRAGFTVFEDLTEAITRALNHPTPEWGVYPVTSWTPIPMVDLSDAEAIGYHPRFTVVEGGAIEPRPR